MCHIIIDCHFLFYMLTLSIPVLAFLATGQESLTQSLKSLPDLGRK